MTPPVALIRPAIRAETAYRVPTTTETGAKLDQNESPFDLPAEVKDAVLAHWRDAPWNRYPDDRPHRLVAALEAHLGVPAGSVIVGHGSNEIVHTLGLCVLDPGVPVVLPHPMFALYASVARMHGAQVVGVDPEPDLSHDADRIAEAARQSGAPLTVVTTPNNPTGQTLPAEALERLAAAVPGLLVVDEAYHEFVDGPTAVDLVPRFPNVLVLRTFSKALALAGVRLGYLVGDPAVMAEIEKARVPFLVDRMGEAVGLEVLARPGLVAERVAFLRAERQRLEAGAEALGAEVRRGTANFFLLRSALPAPTLRERLARRGVLVRDVTGYPALAGTDGRSGWLRVSVGTADENRRFLEALAEALDEEP